MKQDNNLVTTICIVVAVFFGYQMLEQYQSNQVYPTAVQVGGFSLSAILAALTGGLAFFKKFFPNQIDNKVAQIISLIVQLLEENVTWETVKKKFLTSGFPTYISIKIAWDKEVYPIEIGKQPDDNPINPTNNNPINPV